MARRRRPKREVAFSFDSFLDVVANVVGIILRLILVAWVGARSYKAVMEKPSLAPLPPLTAPASLPPPTDDRVPVLARKKQEIGAQEKYLVGVQAQREQLRSVASQLRLDIKALEARCSQNETEGRRVRTEVVSQTRTSRSVTMSLEELQKRAKTLEAEAERLKQLPPKRTEVKFLCPVSAAVQTHELMFECRAGRVTLVDTEALIGQMRRESKSHAEKLRTQWALTTQTAPVGAFRLRYTLEREREVLSGPVTGTPVDGPFRYTRTRWEVDPVAPNRGEAVEKALVEGSDFRKIIDTLDASKTVVTLWVYPDSFALYRRLRDFMHQRDIIVAGRPLPEGVPIASSIHGSDSRGQ